GGFIHIKDGLTQEQLEKVKVLKLKSRGRIEELAEMFSGVEFHPHKTPWGVPVDIAMPCATQNELDGNDARELVGNGVKVVCEGANMPTTLDALHYFREHKVLHAPGKASNAGGVAVSGL